jgi:hypothetical protein
VDQVQCALITLVDTLVSAVMACRVTHIRQAAMKLENLCNVTIEIHVQAVKNV